LEGADVVMEEEEGMWCTEAVLMMMASIQLQLNVAVSVLLRGE
jgi:hypothetical protein